MPYLNQVTIMGHLGREAEVKHTGTGKSVTSFSVAISEGSGDRKTTSWINVEAWELKDFIVAGLTKGALVLVSGKLREDTWESNGKKHSRLKVITDSFGVKTFEKANREPQYQEPAYGPADFGEPPPF